jgi:hypothetical protein
MDSDELERVYGFAEKDMAVIKDDPSWVNLFDHLLELVGDYEPTDEVLAAAGYQNFINDHYYISSFIGAWPKVQHEVADGPFKTFWDTICTNKHNAQNITGIHEFAHIRNLAQLLGVNTLSAMLSDASRKMSTDLKSTVNQYDILKVVDWSRMSGNMPVIVNYVNMREAVKMPILELAYAA